ncbi:amylo-alpha-1,6-glucosidase [Curtobacterium herbarum]|uniref:Glycogen debranching N-terminal domain-containing protein n=1 Tax=Curtobacterium herbarum TaxID=150122 RepID=A0ABN1ZFV4_9MICO|nr:glycogen debranching N-terminal domain-containing protein [Curtobacterium herbarum]MBM7474596.1 glycogen debranching enzyme [Curtobacterium herbarum]MCS6545251.1 amylo-alpha-1,6-glucosidase [Curtobacterium herbarum]
MTLVNPPAPAPTTPSSAPKQPLLHDALVTLTAPTHVWAAPDGSIGSFPVQGYWTGDQRIVSAIRTTVAGTDVEHIATARRDGAHTRCTALLRGLDAPGADPDTRLDHDRSTRTDGIDEQYTVTTRQTSPVDVTLTIRITTDATGMDAIKSGAAPTGAQPDTTPTGATWCSDLTTVTLTAPGAVITIDATDVVVTWTDTATAGRPAVFRYTVTSTTDDTVVEGVTAARPWTTPTGVADHRLQAWLEQASTDLDNLRMRLTGGQDEFLAAGAPWFFTLFGRDSIWAARFLLPVTTELAASTLRVLASLQGTKVDPVTAEQPGKIMHEIRSESLAIDNDELTLSPLYYGTIDATPLWICLLHDAWRAGMPEEEVRALVPALEQALAWMRDYGDSDGDGFLEYVDESGRGLANQGWKDSGDSVQWHDGSLADGPIALCEVQAYAYEAAVHGADILDALDRDGGDAWRSWAATLQTKFRDQFWLADSISAYPAIALDVHKRPVDTVTSNIGHLVGTGLLSADEERTIADRLVAPDMASGFGLRTLSTTAGGFWPLSYHGGSVWTHDTAIAIDGLTRAGLTDQARTLAEGLLRAAVTFDYRMPELHSGDDAADVIAPVPYPAACRPQAWSAASAFPVWVALR